MQVKTKIVKEYISKDGKSYRTREGCRKRDNLIKTVNEIMFPLGNIEDFNTLLRTNINLKLKRTYIQHIPSDVINVKKGLATLIKSILPEEIYNHYMDEVPGNWVSMDEGGYHLEREYIEGGMGGPIGKAWWRLEFVDWNYREWSPYCMPDLYSNSEYKNELFTGFRCIPLKKETEFYIYLENHKYFDLLY